MAGGEGSEAVVEEVRSSADGVVRECVRCRVRETCGRLAPVEQIRSWSPDADLYDVGCSRSDSQTQNQPEPSRVQVPEASQDDERYEEDDDGGGEEADEEESGRSDSFMNSEGVVK